MSSSAWRSAAANCQALVAEDPVSANWLAVLPAAAALLEQCSLRVQCSARVLRKFCETSASWQLVADCDSDFLVSLCAANWLAVLPAAAALPECSVRVFCELSATCTRPVCDHHRVADLAGSREPQLSLQPATRGDKEHKVTFDTTHIYLDESSQSVDSIAKHNRTGAMPVHLVRCLYSQT